jgi:deoxyribodipyrimidine photo-lyase
MVNEFQNKIDRIKMSKTRCLHWFRNDLRLGDNPALEQAAKSDHVFLMYIKEPVLDAYQKMGRASQVWLHHSLLALNADVDQKLHFSSGDPLDILMRFCQENQIQQVVWNRCYEPWRIERDTLIKKQLEQAGITVRTFNGALLWEPWTVAKKDGTPYRVFTPFYRKGCLMAVPPRKPKACSLSQDQVQTASGTLALSELSLLSNKPWETSVLSLWRVGEQAAIDKLDSFLQKGILQYKKGRDFPAIQSVSKLSPHLHFGEISPHQVWHCVRQMGMNENTDHFCSELGWREFSYSQLYYQPDIQTNNRQKKFDQFEWIVNEEHLRCWQKGITGIPMVDAGMRELYQTGFMHNRVRMVVGSFLVKNLLIHWNQGERWFWDCLFDADMASNSASWQWVAGTGADAAPYFRIFNPVTQGKRFDPDGQYIKQYCPELAQLPLRYLFSPWEAPREVLTAAGIRLGVHYPRPIVDLKVSRERALATLKKLSGKSE